MVYIGMTKDRIYDKEETIKCPHCKSDIDLGIDIEIDFEDEQAGATATVTILNKEIKHD